MKSNVVSRIDDSSGGGVEKNILVQECQFSGCFGSLAYKTWNQDSVGSKRVIVLHDLSDNAGIFDRLVSELHHPDGLYVVGLDLPGHGRSHGLPLGSIYMDTSMVNEIRRFVKHLAWYQYDHLPKVIKEVAPVGEKNSVNALNGCNVKREPATRAKFTIIGHGEGAGLALFYARLFPEDVEQIISLDFVKLEKDRPLEILKNTAIKLERVVDVKMAIASNKHAALELCSARDSISEREAVRLIIEARSSLGHLSNDEALHLLERSTQKNKSDSDVFRDGQVAVKEDKRLDNYMNTRIYGELDPSNAADGLECHLLVILARNGRYKDGNDLQDLDDVVEGYKKHCKSFSLFWLEGADHYFLINKVQDIANKINQAML